MVQTRLDRLAERGKTEGFDLIDWLVEAAPPAERNVEMLVERIMALNVASIHTTTMVRLVSRQRTPEI